MATRKADNATHQATFDPALLQSMIDQAVERIMAVKA